MKAQHTAAIAAALLISASAASDAAIILSGDFVNGTTVPTLTITEDIVFTRSAYTSVRIIVFQNWAVSDGTRTATDAAPAQLFAFQNDGIDDEIALDSLTDHAFDTLGSLEANDGFMGISPERGDGDIFTILAGSYTFASNIDFNPELNGLTFTGNVYLGDEDFQRISDIVAVPEPSTMLLCVVGAGFFLRRRR